MSQTSDEASLFRKPPPRLLPTAFSTKPAVEPVGTARRFRPSQAQANDQPTMRLPLGGLAASAIAINLGAIGGTAIFLFSLLVGLIVTWCVADRFRQDSAYCELVEQ